MSLNASTATRLLVHWEHNLEGSSLAGISFSSNVTMIVVNDSAANRQAYRVFVRGESCFIRTSARL